MLRPVKSPNPAWLELAQLVPVITLALPFIAKGEVELSRAASGFAIAAVLFVLVSWFVVRRRGVLNPILVGTGVWLVLGALAFNVPIAALASSLTALQGFALFVAIFVVGVVVTFASPEGFIGYPKDDAAWVRRSSWVLLSLAALTVGWSYRHRLDIRLGGGLPFIVLNVARRLLIRRLR